MNSSLYDINARYLQALDAATDPDSDIPVEMFTDTLDGIEDELENKIHNVIAYSRNLEVEAEAIKSAMDAMKARFEVKKKRSQWLKDYAKQGMRILGKSRLEWPEFSVRIQANPPAVDVIDEKSLPDEFVTRVVETRVDRRAISERLRAGGFVPGAILRTGDSLRVR